MDGSLKMRLCVNCLNRLPDDAHYNTKYCSYKCLWQFHNKRVGAKKRLIRRNKKILKPQRFCPNCNKEIDQLEHHSMKFCSLACRENVRYKKDKVKRLELSKLLYIKNREKIISRQKRYAKMNRDKIILSRKLFRKNNLKKVRIQNMEYYKKMRSNPDWVVKSRLRGLLNSTFKNYINGMKTMHSVDYGVNFIDIIEHLKPFPEDISKYHIDHIRPLCSFTFVKEDGSVDLEEIKKAFAHGNHQWLTIENNLRKGGKWKA